MELPEYDSLDELAEWVQSELGVDGERAEHVARELDAEASHDLGDPADLLDTLASEARRLISDVDVSINSAVDQPAIDSEWVMFKSDEKDGYNRRINSPIVLKQEESEHRVAYAPAMIPREADKEGDVSSTPRVQEAAWGYLEERQEARSGDGVDTDHNLIDNKGTVVESWVLPEAKEWELADGTVKEYPRGTWMLGIKWEPEAWERIQSGELSGLSIYGTAEQIELSKADDGEMVPVFDADGDKIGEMRPQTDSIAQTYKTDGDESGDMGQDSDDEPDTDEVARDDEVDAAGTDTDEVSADETDDEPGGDTDDIERQANQQEIIDVVGTLTPDGIGGDIINQHITAMYDDAGVEPDGDDDGETDDDTEMEEVANDADGITVTVNAEKAERGEVEALLNAVTSAGPEQVKEACDILMDSADGDREDTDDDVARDEGDDTGGGDTTEVDKSAGVVAKGGRGMPEGARADTLDESGGANTDPTANRADVLEDY